MYTILKLILVKILKLLQIIISICSYKLTSYKNNNICVIGVSEIANVLYSFRSLFNKDECILFCKNRSFYYKHNKYDIDISKKTIIMKYILSSFYFGNLAKNARYFIYLWWDGFLLDRNLDFKLLKYFKIPIICYFLGDDIRSRVLYLNYCKSVNFRCYVEYDQPELCLSKSYDLEKLKLAEQADKYANIIFSRPIDQLSYIKSKVYNFPVILNENLFSFNIEKFKNSPIIIIHAPTSPIIKGTPLVHATISKLIHEGYNFKYIELKNVSNELVIESLKTSHIVLNQFYGHIPGVFGLEALSTGNAVLQSAKSDCFPYPFNNAWIETEDWQLYTNLKYLLDNPDKIIMYAKNGYEYIINNFSYMAIKSYLKDIFKKYKIIL